MKLKPIKTEITDAFVLRLSPKNCRKLMEWQLEHLKDGPHPIFGFGYYGPNGTIEVYRAEDKPRMMQILAAMGVKPRM